MDTLCIQKGQWIPLRFTFWADETKNTVVDLTGATLSVSQASLTALLALTPSLSDPSAGIVDLTIWEEQSRQLKLGRVNWFKLEAQFANTNIVTPKIWIKADD